MKWLFALCLAAIFLLGMLFSPLPALSQEAPLDAPEPSGEWIAVARGVVEPTGGLMRLAAQREGLIDTVMVEEGDRVTAGQELARLNDKTATTQLRISEAEVDQSRLQEKLARLRAETAKAERARLAPLGRADALPRRQIEEANRAASVAAVELDLAVQAVALGEQRLEVQRQEIDARVIRAPVDGVIVRRSARPGDGTSTSTVTEMFLLAPDGPRVLKAQLDEQFVGLVSPGQTAEILRERDDGSRITGTVSRVAPVFSGLASSQQGLGQGAARSDDARTLEITIRLDGPKDQIERLVLGQRMIARIKK